MQSYINCHLTRYKILLAAVELTIWSSYYQFNWDLRFPVYIKLCMPGSRNSNRAVCRSFVRWSLVNFPIWFTTIKSYNRCSHCRTSHQCSSLYLIGIRSMVGFLWWFRISVPTRFFRLKFCCWLFINLKGGNVLCE